MTDEQTGQEYEREIPKLETEETSAQWTGGFQFLITVSGYDADVFQLGNAEIPKDAELSSYGTEFLEYLGLPEECYRVRRMWNGAGKPMKKKGSCAGTHGPPGKSW